MNSNPKHPIRISGRQIAVAILFWALNVCEITSAQEAALQCDPAKVLTSQTCIRCHANAYDVWKQTPHFRTFEQMHRSDSARAIANRMGLSSIKRGKVCIECHYTAQQHLDSTRLRVVEGVSCESCHGASKDWINIHNDYGGLHATRAQETESHRIERIATSTKLGMKNPQNPYLIARNCLKCHTVPNEKLVNVGGHKAGSDGFEFVSWSQGMIRHNFIRSNGQANERSTQQRLRLLYLSGLVADLELSVRATGEATQQGVYGKTVATRAANNAVKLFEIQQELQNPLLEEILRSFARAELKTNNADQLGSIADTIKDAGQQLATQLDGDLLEFLDGIIPPPTQYK